MRCIACGEVEWNLRTLTASPPAPQHCRVCGEELRAERRRPGRRFAAFGRERRGSGRSAPN